MNDHEPFIQAIIAEPEDDAPRLVYSDWLEERGDPRAEFIRVQCALARREGPSRLRAEWKERERVLLAEHRTQWLKPLRGLGNRLHFHRGFVDRMNVTAETFLGRGEVLFRLAPIQVVRIMEVGKRIGKIAVYPFLSRLRKLSLTTSLVGPSGIRTLAGSHYLDCLTTLDLSFTRLGEAGVRALIESSHLPNLSILNLAGNLLRGIEALAACPGSGRLTSLSLNFNDISDRGVRVLADSPYLAGLISLSLCDAQIGDAGVRALAASPHLVRLERLSLRRNSIGLTGARALAGSSNLNRLTRLDLAGTDLSRAARRHLKARFGSRVSFT